MGLAAAAASLALAPSAVARTDARGELPAIDSDSALDDGRLEGSRADDALPYLQCVPYARQVSGVRIFGDAHTWWSQAEGRYARGTRPKVGAVMSFRPYGNMRLGHVAAVSRIVDSRTVLLRHANWSPINGRRGQIEDNVRAIDVSPANDWSEVRVWFAPIGALGTTHWPLNGFIYNEPAGPEQPRTVLAAAAPRTAAPVQAAAPRLQVATIGPDFLKGIAPEAASAPAATPAARPAAARAPVRLARASVSAAGDPIGALIAARSAQAPVSR